MKNEKNVKDTTAKATATKKTATPKATKASVAQMLKDMLPQLIKLGGNDLAKKVDDALKSKKSTLESLQSLLSEVVAFGNTAVQTASKKVATENSTKPVVKKPASTKKKAEEPKKTEEKKDLVPTVPQIAGAVPVAKMFPKELTVKDLGKLVVANDKYRNMDDIAKAMNPDDGSEPIQFYIATYWTARHIKEFSYSAVNMVKPVKSFPNDLDLLEPVYYCENNKRIWCASLYTEAMFGFDNDAIEPVKDKDPYSNEEFEVRVSNGMEFEIYILDEQAK